MRQRQVGRRPVAFAPGGGVAQPRRLRGRREHRDPQRADRAADQVFRRAARRAHRDTIANWSNVLRIPLAPYPHLLAFMARIAERPTVRDALAAEGLGR
ncbi:hypothetical protein Bsp3421_003630 [Burkholderia sp. FERM BP-3421]|nr:hypothetical protein [Burkholderia sp. FERM BP-3421]WDD93543.1 hypothetical protein Bsp3421_003630 [Burkholderia sp. FERM BP-3421]